MFNKQLHITTIVLVSLYGAILVTFSIYLQGALFLESRAYSVSLIKTAKYNLISSLWWYTVGYPLLLGAFFIVASIKLYKVKEKSTHLRYLVTLIAVSTVGAFFASLEGVVGAVVSGIGLLIHATQKT